MSESQIEQEQLQVFQRLKLYIRDRSGQLVSRKFGGVRSRVKVKCSRGHVWETLAANLLYKQSWCPHCYKGIN